MKALLYRTVLAFCLIGASAGLYTGGSVYAQSGAFLEGTNLCVATSFWFSDAYYRAGAKNRAAIEPYLVLFTGLDTPQDVTVTLRPSGNPIVHIVQLPPRQRLVIDLGVLVNRLDVEFAVEVDFQGLGHADLKLTSNGAVTPVTGLALCR